MILGLQNSILTLKIIRLVLELYKLSLAFVDLSIFWITNNIIGCGIINFQIIFY